jgi:hypothetical protein
MVVIEASLLCCVIAEVELAVEDERSGGGKFI